MNHVKGPTNTATRQEINAIAPLAMVIGTEAIELQERQGQSEAVKSETLPVTRDAKLRAQYEALGFVFGEPLPSDKLFCSVQMPQGWSKRRTDHSMHNDIVDAAGNKRGSFFYKASFYDRDAILYPPTKRYGVRSWYNDGERSKDIYEDRKLVRYEVVDNTTDTVLHTVEHTVVLEPPTQGGDHRAWWDGHDALNKKTAAECVSWLDEHYPDHVNPGAYWPT
jgi:hypothetical protein